MGVSWQLHQDYADLSSIAPDLDAVFSLAGDRLAKDKKSEVLRIEHAGIRYYVKRYRNAGRSLKSLLWKPRIESEWLNLQRFESWGIPTAKVIGWGMERRWGLFHRGAMITREIDHSTDLAHLAKTQDSRINDPTWLKTVTARLANSTRILHAHHFAHNDLKWRNLLVDNQQEIFLIDCPTGGFWYGPFMEYRIIKDLACLDKVARHHLSRTQRLRFYLHYIQQPFLSNAHKKQICRILYFFNGRE